MARAPNLSPNLNAYLDMIAWSEGTKKIPDSDDGYRAIVGGTVFTSYADHPRELVHLNAHLESTAAGRYQLLARFWDVYRIRLHLQDFGPVAQDAVAIQQIRESHALEDLEAGRFASAVLKCNHIWASLYGSPYGQHTNPMVLLETWFRQAGGIIA